MTNDVFVDDKKIKDILTYISGKNKKTKKNKDRAETLYRG